MEELIYFTIVVVIIIQTVLFVQNYRKINSYKKSVADTDELEVIRFNQHDTSVERNNSYSGNDNVDDDNNNENTGNDDNVDDDDDDDDDGDGDGGWILKVE